MLDRAEEGREFVIGLRRRLHQHPELGGAEAATSAMIAEQLGELGLQVRSSIGNAVLGVLPGGGDGPGILLRAELDALPITEVPGRPHGSRVPGMMHACGHDGHMAILVGTARLLATERRLLRGDVYFLFQPAEEQLPDGGARELIEAGVLEGMRLQLAAALHLWPDLPLGTVGIPPGPVMAAGDIFRVTFSGNGGHAGQPHTAADTVAAAGYTAAALPGLVRRRVNALLPAVIAVGMVHGGASPNVLPAEANLAGTTRYFEPGLGDTLERHIRDVAREAGELYGCRADTQYRHGYPPVVNHPDAARAVARSAARVLGEGAVRTDLPPSTLADDFSYIAQRVPAAYFWLGIATPDHPTALHRPDFDLPDDALVYGTAILTQLCLDKLGA
ncbi:MAG TPA: amidohydrolase [Clostridiales bacterium]|nr:amidohydrolase [Clostridiales bacterium]